jgi:hypothetical protein
MNLRELSPNPDISALSGCNNQFSQLVPRLRLLTERGQLG